MKTKIILFVLGVAVVTLSFTFATADKAVNKEKMRNSAATGHSEPVGGLYADQVVE
ncbi:MAG: hypothetical protein WEB30_13460 [Cyclobacteriaceae bacterium]